MQLLLPEEQCIELVETRRKAIGYAYRHYLDALPADDKEWLVALLQTISDKDRILVEDGKQNYENVIKCGLFGNMSEVESELARISEDFKTFNAELDKYGVDPEMRFDADDLSVAMEFHRDLFTFLPDPDREAVIQKRREKFGQKKISDK